MYIISFLCGAPMQAKNLLPYAFGLISFAPFSGQAQNLALQAEALNMLMDVDGDQGKFTLSSAVSANGQFHIEATKPASGHKETTLFLMFKDNGDHVLDVATDTLLVIDLKSNNLENGIITDANMTWMNGDKESYFVGRKGQGTEERMSYGSIKVPNSSKDPKASKDLKVYDALEAAKVVIQNFRP